MKPELLIPVGSPEALPIALAFGADAVYLGSDALSLRAKAENFSDRRLREALRYTHERGKKLYLAVNIFAREADLAQAEQLFETLAAWEEKPDAFIVSDFGIIRLARRILPEVPLHISTQTNSTNSETIRFWQEQGASRVVCARELSLAEISAIREKLPPEMELEAFVHGSLCMAYSGRCLISSFLTGREANRGLCTQPCRWQYAISEEKRPGLYMPLEETERGTYLFNAKDLCMIEYLPRLIQAGICSLKVEGRMKNELYIATIARAYRLTMDALAESPAAYEALLPWLKEEVLKCTTRDYCTGFYFGPPAPEDYNYQSSAYRQDYRYLGLVEEDAGGLFIRQKNKFLAGESIEAIRPGGENIPLTVDYFESEEGERRESCPHPEEKLYIHTGVRLQAFDILRKENL